MNEIVRLLAEIVPGCSVRQIDTVENQIINKPIKKDLYNQQSIM